MKTLVTGATGFTGRALAHRLLDQGDQVVALVRNPASCTDLEKKGAQIVTGDLMLVYQAVEQVKIWLGIEPPAGVMIEALRNALTEPNGPEE